MNHSARRANELARQLNTRRYLEIGVHAGDTFREVEIPERTGVDPRFAFDTTEVNNDFTRCIENTSDEFFKSEPLFPPYDLVFIDGLHKFEQVVRDFSNSIVRTHKQSVLLIDDTLPNDVYSAIPDMNAAYRFRMAIGNSDRSWHGDVFKIVFYIHDFWPSLNYRTIVESGNPQTLVWRSNKASRRALYDSFEQISRMTYFDLLDNIDVMQTSSEEAAISLCISEIKS